MDAPKQNLPLAALISVSACLVLAAAGACIKLASADMSTYVILFCQNCIGLALTLPQVFHKGWQSLKTEKWKLHLARDSLGVVVYFFMIQALKTVPLAVGALLNNTAPLWVPLVALVWLRVRMDSYVWWSVIIGFAGITLILQPSADVLSLGAILALCSGIFASFAYLLIGKLASTEPTHRILFFYFLVGSIVTLPLAYFSYTTPTKLDVLYLLGEGVFIFFGQMLMTQAFHYGKISIIAPISYTIVAYSALFDWLIWDRIPNWLACLGGALVILGAILAIYFEKRYQKKLSPPL